MKDLTGITIEKYKIVREMGRGGMAVVYRAMDTMLERNVAVKMILSETDNKEKAEKLLKRFNREAKILASLSHPNIVKVLDYGEYESTPYLVMEFISGGALKSKMGRPIPYAEAAALLIPIARALQHAHQQKIVHRDVKPENILINDSEQPMLSDFGILKLVDVEESHGLTGTGKIVGTPAYMSPEQIRGREVDGRSDMYALGVVFFEMITGRRPYNANTPIELSMQHLHDPIPKAKQFIRDLPAEVDQVITKAIAKNPEDRYPTMGAFAQALEKLSGTTARTTTAERRAIKAAEEKKLQEEREKPKRSLSPVLISILAGLLVVGGVGAWLLSQNLATLISTATPAQTSSSVPTVALPSPSPTTEIIATETAIQAAEIATSTPNTLSELILQPSNASRIVEIDRLDRISVIKLDWVQNGNWLIDAGSSTVFFIKPETSEITKVSLDGGIPLAMSVTDNHAYILLNDSIKVIDIKTLKVTKVIAPISGGAISIAASPDEKLLALGISDNKTQLLNTETGTVVRNLKSNYGGWAVGFSPDSKYVISGTSRGILKWETETGIWGPITGGQDLTFKSLAFSHDGKTIAAGGDGILYIWNVEDGSLLHQVEDNNFGIVNSIDFSPDDSMLVTGTDDNMVRVWEVGSASILAELSGHASQVFGVCFSPDGEKIASGANEGSILFWGLP